MIITLDRLAQAIDSALRLPAGASRTSPPMSCALAPRAIPSATSPMARSRPCSNFPRENSRCEFAGKPKGKRWSSTAGYAARPRT